jgi:hypothetical protein
MSHSNSQTFPQLGAFHLARTGAQVFAAGCAVAIAVLAAAPSGATSRIAQSAQSLPICYIQLPSQSLQSLDKLCGVLPPAKTIPLYTTDGTTPSPELIAAVRQTLRPMRSATSQLEVLKIMQPLMAKLPLSDRARALQAQVDTMAQRSEFDYEKFSQLQEQLIKDPSYQQAREALTKAREYLWKQQAKR